MKLNPTKDQKLYFNRAAGCARFTYNQVVAALNDGSARLNRSELQDRFLTKKYRDGSFNSFFKKKRWLLVTSSAIRQQAIFEAMTAFKAAFTNKQRGNIEKFKIQFKTKRREIEQGYSLGIAKHLKNNDGILKILPRDVGNMRYYGKLPFDGVPEAECRIQRDRWGDFWLLVPMKKQTRESSSGHIVAIDPGVRKPVVTFATDGSSSVLGLDMNERLSDIRTRISITDRRIAKSQDPKLKKRLRDHRRRLFRKHIRIRDYFHYQMINTVIEGRSGVLIPPFETQRISKKLKSKTNRCMLGISHYTFRMRMKHRCEELGMLFSETTEEYTSKTCGMCGRLNFLLGSKETFECPYCDNVMDRDIHAARNILIKWLTEDQTGP